MNKNNLKRIAVFMSMIATFQSRLSAKNIMPVVAYGGPGFFRERFEENEEKKDADRKFYQNPKIMVPVVIGGTTVLVSAILLSLLGTGVIGKEDKKEDKKEKKVPFKVPFDDYRKLVEKIYSGEVLGYCSGVANYDYNGKTFSPSFNGVDDDFKNKPEICKKLDAGLLTKFASSFVEIKSGKKWRLSTDNDSIVGRVEVTIFFNSVKKQYELKFLCASGNRAHKYSVKLDDVVKK